MDIRKLEHFLSVADHQGFTAAAREGSVSQPGLSLAVRDLEHELGVPLFERRGRQVLLTEAGAALVGPARQVLRDLETGRAAVAAVAGVEAGTLWLASLPTLAADPMAGLVGQFRQSHPGMVVDLAAPEDTSDLAAMVREGRCEVGVTETATVPDDLVSHHLGDQALYLVLPRTTVVRSGPLDIDLPATAIGTAGPSSGLAGPAGAFGAAPSVALVDLVDVPFIATPVGTSTRRLLDEGFASAGTTANVAVVTAQRDAILPLVLAGAGAALVPEPIAVVAVTLGAIVARPDPAVVRSIALVHRRGPLSPAAARFVELAGAHSE